jgi:hypothetical protein
MIYIKPHFLSDRLIHHHSTLLINPSLTNNKTKDTLDLDIARTETVLGGLFVCGRDFESLLKILINDSTRDDGVDDGVGEGEVLSVTIAESDVIGTNGHGEMKTNKEPNANGNDGCGGDSIVILEAGRQVKLEVEIRHGKNLIADLPANHEGNDGQKDGEEEGYTQLGKGVSRKDLDKSGITLENAEEASHGSEGTNVRKG